MELYQIVQLIVAAVIGVLYIVQRFTGISFMEKIVQWKPVLIALGATLKAVSGALPSEDQKMVITVLDAACKGAEAAEELWLLGGIPKEDRNSYAKYIVENTLTNANIVITDQIRAIIDGGIEMMCLLMPHGLEPETKAN